MPGGCEHAAGTRSCCAAVVTTHRGTRAVPWCLSSSDVQLCQAESCRFLPVLQRGSAEHSTLAVHELKGLNAAHLVAPHPEAAVGGVHAALVALVVAAGPLAGQHLPAGGSVSACCAVTLVSGPLQSAKHITDSSSCCWCWLKAGPVRSGSPLRHQEQPTSFGTGLAASQCCRSKPGKSCRVASFFRGTPSTASSSSALASLRMMHSALMLLVQQDRRHHLS